jgi:quercetin dioxygenase-like cupin family protein
MQQELSKAGAAKRTSLAAAMTLLILGSLVAITVASPPSGVKPTPLVRGTYHDFKVKTDPESPIDFRAKSKSPVDVFVRQHDYEPGGSTGWHSHPGPVFITVNKGTLTYYLRSDPECEPHVVRTGEGFVDDGHGHIVFNETDEPAQDISVILAPVGGAFRGELDAPDPDCGF